MKKTSSPDKDLETSSSALGCHNYLTKLKHKKEKIIKSRLGALI